MKKLFALLAVLVVSFSVMGQEISTDTLIPQRQVIVAPVYIATWEVNYPGDSVLKFNDLITSRTFWRRAGTGAVCWDSTPAIRIKQRGIDTLNKGRGYTLRWTLEAIPR